MPPIVPGRPDNGSLASGGVKSKHDTSVLADDSDLKAQINQKLESIRSPLHISGNIG